MARLRTRTRVEDVIGNAIIGVFNGIGKTNEAVSYCPPRLQERDDAVDAQARHRREMARVGDRAQSSWNFVAIPITPAYPHIVQEGVP